MTPRKLYGWEENGKFILSLFKRIGGNGLIVVQWTR